MPLFALMCTLAQQRVRAPLTKRSRKLLLAAALRAGAAFTHVTLAVKLSDLAAAVKPGNASSRVDGNAATAAGAAIPNVLQTSTRGAYGNPSPDAVAKLKARIKLHYQIPGLPSRN